MDNNDKNRFLYFLNYNIYLTSDVSHDIFFSSLEHDYHERVIRQIQRLYLRINSCVYRVDILYQDQNKISNKVEYN